MINAFTMLGASFALVVLFMVALWVVYFFQRNGGIVDIGWCIGVLLASWAYFFLGHGDFFKKFLVTGMATIWAVRLGVHLFLRFDVNKEDPRYSRLREGWGGDANGSLFLMMFIFQGLLVIIVATPLFLVDLGSNAEWSPWEFIGMTLWLIGLGGEVIADRQLTAFIKDPANTGKVCNQGLWRFSRHPNYFFEFTVWMGFFLFAVPSYLGFFAVISPILVLLLLLKVSGIPLTEAHSLKSKGDLYREYQRTTSAFIPWFPSE